MKNKIPNGFIEVSATLSHHGNNEIINILDDNLETIYASEGKYTSGYVDIYFKFSKHMAVEGLEFYTSNSRGWGLVQRYEILYKNDISTAGWISIYGVTESQKEVGWRTAQFQPVYAKEICIRVRQSHGGYVTINEAKVYQDFKLYTDMVTLVDESKDGELTFSESTSLPLVEEISSEYPTNKEVQKIMDIIRYNYLSKSDLNKFKNSFIRRTRVNTKEFCDRLKIKETKRLSSLNTFIEGKENILLISDKDCEILHLEHNDKFISNVLKIKSGLNKLFISNPGELFLLGDISTDANFKIYGGKETNTFRIGESKFPEFIGFQKERSHIFVEGKNFITNLRTDWIKDNFNEHDFIDAILAIDVYFDYLYNTLDMTLHYEKNMIKRLLWLGDSTEKVQKIDSDVGSYLTFGGDATLFFQKGIHKLANSLFCKLTSDEIVSETHFSPELASVLNLGFFKTFELKYQKNIELTNDVKKDIFVKILMYSNSDRFMTRLYRNYYSYEFSVGEKSLDKLVLWMSELLFRNIGVLFSQRGYEISQDILNECEKYPNLFINIDEITSENYKDFRRREVVLFNQSYLAKIQEKETR